MATRLIFDITITGHHTEYIGHLMRYFKQHPSEGKNIFVVHPHFKEKFPHLVPDANANRHIQFVEVTNQEYQKATAGSLFRQSFAMLKLVKQYAGQHKCTQVFLLSFNVFQIGLIFIRPAFKISGILFLQFYRMSKGNWSERLKYFRKYLITKLYSNNKQIDRIFILNDPKTAVYLNNQFRKGLFHVLNDPIPALAPLSEFNIYERYHIAHGRKILLHLGALDDRKGTLEFIQSALHIKSEFQEELAFLVAGSPGGAKMAEKIDQHIRLVNEATKIKAIYEPGFLPDAKMKSILDQCDAIVIPYKNPEASSGILGHAAASNKPLIATGKGLLKELIEQYNLGLLVDEVKPELIADKIEMLHRIGEWKSESSTFVAERTPEIFASTIVAKANSRKNKEAE